MPPNEQRQLIYLAAKYLKHLRFVKAASSHTSKSYATDLGQFLQAPRKFHNLYSRSEGKETLTDHENVTGNVGDPVPLLVSSDALKALISEGLNQWRRLSPASRNRKVAVVRSFCKWLVEEGHLQEDLSARLISPKIPQRLPHFIGIDDTLVLLNHLKGQFSNEVRSSSPAFPLILLLYGCGLRVSEACALKWGEVMLDRRELRVHGKGGKVRVVALPLYVAEILKSMSDSGNGGSWVLGGHAPLSERKAYELVRKAGAAAGLAKPLHPHALRHSYATHLLSSGADLRIIQELLGHSSLAATQKYTHLTVDELARTLTRHHPLSYDKD